ncbi:MAG: ABC transporter ATP-binding protein [Acidobacteria bacterium]|nr:ABC transporter ATP-binding protein [Acidobacteriota bacterium]
MTGPGPLLDVRGLTTEFVAGRRAASRTVRAVDGISFQIQRGETLGLVGESGSGKSVAALSLIRLVPAPGRVVSGTVEFEGRDLLTLNDAAMRQVRGARIGFVFQEPMTALNPVFTVGSQIADALMVHGIASGAAARARAVELLDMVRIPDAGRRAGDYPHQFSGGMRQRALIAAAIACQPSLLVADEPTTALDVTIQADVLDLLREMRRRMGLALLIITHDLGVVAQLADRVAVMYAGRIVETGPTRDVLSAPCHPYTRGLLASLPGSTPGGRLAAIPGTVPDLASLPAGCAFAPRCADRVEVCDERPPDPVSAGPGRSVRCARVAETS